MSGAAGTAGASFFGNSLTTASVVTNKADMLAALSKADLVTLVGSMIPPSIMLRYVPVLASNP